MAELALSAALIVIEIAPQIYKLQAQVQDEIDNMKSWLSSMKAFMEENNGQGEGFQVKVEKVRNIAYEIEDVIEEYALHTTPYTFHRYSINRKAHNLAHQFHHGFPLHGISKKIKTIQKQMKAIRDQSTAFPHNNSNQRPSSSSSSSYIMNGLQASPLLLDDEMVGYEKPKKEFVDQLMDGEKRLVRLAMVGPLGSGKTTFVKNVYWKPGIRRQFDCHAWISVSRHFDLEELISNMLRQFCYSSHQPYPADDGTNSLAKTRKFLAGKQYIVVLDDVCRKEDWDRIALALPDPLRGCRIIITTRSAVVASSVCTSSNDHIYSLNGLEWLEAWTLFCRKAFPNSNRECPSELKDCCVRIVKRCEGLPLAIVAIGKALEKKKSRVPNDWEKFHDSLLGCESNENSNLFVIRKALQLEYMDLSSNLKSCLLYFSIFPEDHSVTRGRLTRLWVAEGFAKGTDGRTAEEVAEDYLNELINRNLVDVSKWDFDGRPKICRVTSFVLQFIIGKCKDENFASISPIENANQSQKIRRLSVSILPQNINYGGVRSLFFSPMILGSNVNNDLDQNINLHWPRRMFRSRSQKTFPPDFQELLSALRLVRILDFRCVPLTEFPRDIARLSLLKYLNLSDTKIKMIPSSIEKLSYLEALDLKQTDVTHLPKEISHLHKLRHLLAYKKNDDKNVVLSDPVQGVGISPGISNLTNLQKLSVIKVDENGRILNDLTKTTQLRKLGLTGLKREHGSKLNALLGQMRNLVTLDICSTAKEENLQLGDIMSHLHSDTPLQRLYLNGRLNRFPASISPFKNLRRIRLKWSGMDSSLLMALQGLQYLMEIQLVDCYVEKEMIFEASCFKTLKILVIEELAQLHTIVIKEGAMPELKELSLRRCPELKMCPLGIDNLTKVEELTLYDMARELSDRLSRNGEDSWMVEHIRVVSIGWKKHLV